MSLLDRFRRRPALEASCEYGHLAAPERENPTCGAVITTEGVPLFRLFVEFKRLSSTAVIPAYATEQAAGMDLCADHDASIAPGTHKLILTNIAIRLPRYFEAQVRPRSGLALKKGITVLNSPGTIDADYRGGIGVILYNAGSERFTVKPGDRIAQLVFAPVWHCKLTEVEEFNHKTERGAGGFGSTGV